MCLCDNFFFFKQKTAYEMRISDWSSDVCSSDLQKANRPITGRWPSYFATEAFAAILEVSTGGSVRIVAAYSAISTKSQNPDPAHSSMVAPFTRSMARKTTANRRKNIKLEIGIAACRERECQYV